jgi:hypothetical protein
LPWRSKRWRRLRDAVALNVGAAIGLHLLTLGCRLIEAKRQAGRDAESVLPRSAAAL